MAQIMIVEDNQGTNKAICEYLKTAGHTLFPALDGEEALNIFRDNSIDLAVLDIMLPKMSGVTILHEIRKISNIPVVMLTAVDDELLSINPHCLGSRTKYRLASEVLMKRTKFSLVCLIIRSPRFFRQSCMTVTVIGTLARIIQKLNCMRLWSNTQTIRLNLEI